METGQFALTLDGPDEITIAESAGALMINGNDPGIGAVAASKVTSIVISAAGEHDNHIDLSTVDPTRFPALESVSILSGAGDDEIVVPLTAFEADGGGGDDVLSVFGDRTSTDVVFSPSSMVLGEGDLVIDGFSSSFGTFERVHINGAREVSLRPQVASEVLKVRNGTIDTIDGSDLDAIQINGIGPPSMDDTIPAGIFVRSVETLIVESHASGKNAVEISNISNDHRNTNLRIVNLATFPSQEHPKQQRYPYPQFG